MRLRPDRRLAQVLETIHPNTYANIIPAEVSPKPTTAIIFRETDTVTITNFDGAERDHTVFRIQFHSQDYEEAMTLSDNFKAIAADQTPKMIWIDASTYFDEDRSLHLREVTVQVY